MTGKWLRRTDKALVPASRDTLPVVTGEEFDRRMTEFMRAKGITEQFCLTTFCREQRRHYVTTFERQGPDKLFRKVRVEAIDPFSLPGKGPVPKVETFDVDALGDWECPCGTKGLVFCYCGRNSCNAEIRPWRVAARLRRKAKARRRAEFRSRPPA